MLKSFENMVGRERAKDPELEIASLSTSERREGIPIPDNDFHALAKALETYAAGVGEASNITSNDRIPTDSDITSNVALPEGKYSQYVKTPSADIKGPYSKNPFIDKIVRAVEEAHLDGKKRWSKHYDYDGQGRFHKTSVNIAFDRENNTLILSLNAAYVTKDAVEEELARALKIPRAVSNIVVKAGLPDMPDQDLSIPPEQRQTFQFDCAPLTTAVNSVVQKFGNPERQFKPKDLVKSFMKSEHNRDEGLFTVKLKDGIVLTLNIYGGDRFVCPTGKKGLENFIDTRKRKGSTLILPFPTEIDINKPFIDYYYSVPAKEIKNYSIIANIERDSEDRDSRSLWQLPLHKKEQLEKARAVTKYFNEQLENLAGGASKIRHIILP